LRVVSPRMVNGVNNSGDGCTGVGWTSSFMQQSRK
jgi:hypothetical protein